MDVEVVPDEFRNVHFDAGEIRALVERLLGEAGLAGRDDVAPVRVEVDESTPLGRTALVSLQPLVITAQSGALEDRQRLRQFGPAEAADALGRRIFAAADRLDPAFGAPPLDEEVPLSHAVAWDTYVVGRMARQGHRPQRQRRLYTFELRHGFTDAAVAAFERLWTADRLSFPEIVAISDEARAVAVG